MNLFYITTIQSKLEKISFKYKEIKLSISVSVKINSVIVEDLITGHNFLSYLSLTLLCDLHFLPLKVVYTFMCLDYGLSHMTFFGCWILADVTQAVA